MQRGKTNTLLKYAGREHETQSSLNTAASLVNFRIGDTFTHEKLNSLLLVKRNIDILENNDVMIKTRGV